ncbi:MAG: hypothetical protein AAGF12_00375 [Myxococcota bacterium]
MRQFRALFRFLVVVSLVLLVGRPASAEPPRFVLAADPNTELDAALGAQLVDLPIVVERMVLPEAGSELTVRIRWGRATALAHRALAVFVVEPADGAWFVSVFANGSRLLARRIDAGTRAASIEETAVLLRAQMLALAEGGLIEVATPRLPLPPPRAEFPPRFVADLGYEQSFAGADLGLRHSAAIRLAIRLNGWAEPFVAYTFTPPGRVEMSAGELELTGHRGVIGFLVSPTTGSRVRAGLGLALSAEATIRQTLRFEPSARPSATLWSVGLGARFDLAIRLVTVFSVGAYLGVDGFFQRIRHVSVPNDDPLDSWPVRLRGGLYLRAELP